MKIILFDLGGQYAHLIWRTLRDLEIECDMVPKDYPLEHSLKADALVFSGGPSSVSKENYSTCEAILELKKTKGLKIPLFGICLGHQLIAHRLGGRVARGERGEYGLTEIEIVENGLLLKGLPTRFRAWASHFDTVEEIPTSFTNLARSDACRCEAMESQKMKVFSTQFHPEVWHTEYGLKIFENFLEAVDAK